VEGEKRRSRRVTLYTAVEVFSVSRHGNSDTGFLRYGILTQVLRFYTSNTVAFSDTHTSFLYIQFCAYLEQTIVEKRRGLEPTNYITG
jgi:hypothetical protein